jgi:hypothetical protein
MSRPDYNDTAEQLDNYHARLIESDRVERGWHEFRTELDMDRMLEDMALEDVPAEWPCDDEVYEWLAHFMHLVHLERVAHTERRRSYLLGLAEKVWDDRAKERWLSGEMSASRAVPCS